MKKLLSILLTLALVLTLAAPAVAAEAAAPTWSNYGYATLAEYLSDSGETEASYYAWSATPAEQTAWAAAYALDHPDESAAFDADAYFAQEFGYYDSKEEFMTDWGLTTDGEFRAAALCSYIYDQLYLGEIAAQWEAVKTAEPERTAQFLAGIENMLATEYDVSTMEEYMESYGVVSAEQAYIYLYDSWKWRYEYELERKAAHDKKLTDLGGTVGQINVLVDGKCLSLAAGQLKAVDGAVSLPADMLSKALGITITDGADGYAPIRANAEKAGYQVFWDEEYQAVVLINKKGIIADTDEKLSQLTKLVNGMAEAVKPQPGQAYASSGSLTTTVTLFNTLDGDTSYTLSCKASAIQKDGSLSGSVTLDVAALLKQLSAGEKERFESYLPQKLTLNQLITLASGLTVNFIFDVADESFSFNVPALASFLNGYEKDTWVRLDMDGLGEVMAGVGDISIGALLYEQAVPSYYSSDYYYGSYLDLYAKLSDSVGLFTALLGNDRFTEKNGELTYRLDTKTVNSLVEKLTQSDYSAPVKDAFRTAEATLSLSGSGKTTASVSLRPNISGITGYTPYLSGILSFADFRYTADASTTAEAQKLSGEFHWKNQFKVKVDLNGTTQKTSKTPAPAPAAEECLDSWDFEALLSTFFSNVDD